mmetsp:Transcript_30069/g.64850  ORF Transcript_30069/g.64850 Transcript_30069/m.64850 type:complete len:272 (-) Transcript_30069:863-1678(-)
MESITNRHRGHRDCSRPHVAVNSTKKNNSPRITQCNRQRHREETLPSTDGRTRHPERIISTHRRNSTVLPLPAPRTSQVHPSRVRTASRTRCAGVPRTSRRDYPRPSLACCCRRCRSRPCRSIPIGARAVSGSGGDTAAAATTGSTVIDRLRTKVVTMAMTTYNNNADGREGSAVAALAARALPRRNSSTCLTSTTAVLAMSCPLLDRFSTRSLRLRSRRICIRTTKVTKIITVLLAVTTMIFGPEVTIMTKPRRVLSWSRIPPKNTAPST